jgi:hypothetical protein
MYCVFPLLPPINTNSSPSEVSKWKKNQNVAKCYKNLFKREETADDSATYMTRIIDKVWASKKNTPKIHIAYAISVCEFLLNPSNQKVQVSEASIKYNISKYLVSFSLNREIINLI